MMPFNSNTAAAAGRKGGKLNKQDKDPANFRTKAIPIKVSPVEFDAINDKAAALGLSRAELIVRAVAAYEGRYPVTAQKKDTLEECTMIDGERVLYYPYPDPVPQTPYGAKIIGERPNGEQIIQYDGEAFANMIEPVIQQIEAARSAKRDNAREVHAPTDTPPVKP